MVKYCWVCPFHTRTVSSYKVTTNTWENRRERKEEEGVMLKICNLFSRKKENPENFKNSYLFRYQNYEVRDG